MGWYWRRPFSSFSPQNRERERENMYECGKPIATNCVENTVVMFGACTLYKSWVNVWVDGYCKQFTVCTYTHAKKKKHEHRNFFYRWSFLIFKRCKFIGPELFVKSIAECFSSKKKRSSFKNLSFCFLCILLFAFWFIFNGNVWLLCL